MTVNCSDAVTGTLKIEVSGILLPANNRNQIFCQLVSGRDCRITALITTHYSTVLYTY